MVFKDHNISSSSSQLISFCLWQSISIYLSITSIQRFITSSDGHWKFGGVWLYESIKTSIVSYSRLCLWVNYRKSSLTKSSKYYRNKLSFVKSIPSYSFANLSKTSTTLGLFSALKQLCLGLPKILLMHSKIIYGQIGFCW